MNCICTINGCFVLKFDVICWSRFYIHKTSLKLTLYKIDVAKYHQDYVLKLALYFKIDVVY